MERIIAIDLTTLEKERCNELREKYGCMGYLYLVTENCPGVGYNIIWSPDLVRKFEDLNENNSFNITDIDSLLENI